MNNYLYFPFLKSKRGEAEAVKNLDEKIKNLTLPIIGVCPFENPKDTLNRTLEFFQCWGEREAIVDVSAIDVNATIGPSLLRDKTEVLPLIFQELREQGHSFIPSITLNQEKKTKTIRNLYKKGYCSKICVRIQLMDIRNYEHLNGIIKLRLQEIGIHCHNVYLVFDFGFVDSINLNHYERLSEKVLTRIPNRDEFNETVLLSSSFSMKDVSMDCEPVKELPRFEMHLWESARIYDHLLKYGDYGIIEVTQATESKFKGNRISPKIRVSTPERYLVKKGNTGNRKEQYPPLAKDILEVCGGLDVSSSWGDRLLTECSQGRFLSGNLTTWVAIDTNHHIHHTVKRLEAIEKKKSSKIGDPPHGFHKGIYAKGK